MMPRGRGCGRSIIGLVVGIVALLSLTAQQVQCLRTMCAFQTGGSGDCDEAQGFFCVPIFPDECFQATDTQFFSIAQDDVDSYTVSVFTDMNCQNSIFQKPVQGMECAVTPFVHLRVVELTDDFSPLCIPPTVPLPFAFAPRETGARLADAFIAPSLMQSAELNISLSGTFQVSSGARGADDSLLAEFSSSTAIGPVQSSLMGEHIIRAQQQDLGNAGMDVVRSIAYDENEMHNLAIEEDTLISATLTMSLANGETAALMCQRTVSVADTVPPEVTCFTPILPVVSGTMSRTVLIPPFQASDNGPLLSVMYPHEVTVQGLAPLTFTATAIDSANLQSSCNITVMPVDEAAPTFTCPSDVTIVADPGETTITYALPVIDDAVDPEVPTEEPIVLFSLDNNTVLSLGETMVTVAVADLRGNEDSCQYTVRVVAAPAVLETSRTTIIAFEDRPIERFCNFSGYPLPNITWYFNDDFVIQTDVGTAFSDNSFESVTYLHTGTYQCVATNEYGTAEGPRLSVLARPTLPYCGGSKTAEGYHAHGTAQNTRSWPTYDVTTLSDLQEDTTSIASEEPAISVLTTTLGTALHIYQDLIVAHDVANATIPLFTISVTGHLVTRNAGPFLLGDDVLVVTLSPNVVGAFDVGNVNGNSFWTFTLPQAATVPCTGDFNGEEVMILCHLQTGMIAVYRLATDDPSVMAPELAQTQLDVDLDSASLADTTWRSTWPPALSADHAFAYAVVRTDQLYVVNTMTGAVVSTYSTLGTIFAPAVTHLIPAIADGPQFLNEFVAERAMRSPSRIIYLHEQHITGSGVEERVVALNDSLLKVWQFESDVALSGPISVFANTLTAVTLDNVYMLFADSGVRRFKRLVSRATESGAELALVAHDAYVLNPFAVMEVASFNQTVPGESNPDAVRIETNYVFIIIVNTNQFFRYTITHTIDGAGPTSMASPPLFAATQGHLLMQPAYPASMPATPIETTVLRTCVRVDPPSVIVDNNHLVTVTTPPAESSVASFGFSLIVSINGTRSRINGVTFLSGLLPNTTVDIAAVHSLVNALSVETPFSSFTTDAAPDLPRRGAVFVRVAVIFEGFTSSRELIENFSLLSALRGHMCRNTGSAAYAATFCYPRSVRDITFAPSRRRITSDAVEVTFETVVDVSRQQEVEDGMQESVNALEDGSAEFYELTGGRVSFFGETKTIVSADNGPSPPTGTTADPNSEGSSGNQTVLIAAIAAACGLALIVLIIIIISRAKAGKSTERVTEKDIIAMLDKNPFQSMHFDNEAYEGELMGDGDGDEFTEDSSTLGGRRMNQRAPAPLPATIPANGFAETPQDTMAMKAIKVAGNKVVPGAAFDIGFIEEFCAIKRSQIDLKISVREVKGAKMHVAEYTPADAERPIQALVWEFMSSEEPESLATRLSVQELISDILRLEHRNIVQAFGLCNLTHPLLVLESSSEGSVFRYLQQTKVPDARLYQWMGDIARGVQFLSSKRIVHGNIWSRECLISAGFRVQLNCSPLLRSLAEALEMPHTADEFRASPRWAAPETIQNRFSSASDVWAMAVTFWEMFHRCLLRPFDELDNPADVTRLVKNENMRLDQPESCPDEIWSLLETCWHIQRSKRPHINLFVKDFDRITNEIVTGEEFDA